MSPRMACVALLGSYALCGVVTACTGDFVFDPRPVDAAAPPEDSAPTPQDGPNPADARPPYDAGRGCDATCRAPFYRCDAPTGLCLELCIGDDDDDDDDSSCSQPGFACSPTLNICVNCAASANCTHPSAPHCERRIGRCLP